MLHRNASPSSHSEPSTSSKQSNLSLERFLEIAIEPVGQTMYVWGGGWNEEDTGAGVEAVTIGVSDHWASFFEDRMHCMIIKIPCIRFTMDWIVPVM